MTILSFWLLEISRVSTREFYLIDELVSVDQESSTRPKKAKNRGGDGELAGSRVAIDPDDWCAFLCGISGITWDAIQGLRKDWFHLEVLLV
ncbi:hypothetical protein ColKHC_03329 [Colletotrichum higginsianum]|nr:hypothetical protein ColKHC_03329 [Colletotrichum higginsianum]